MDRESMKLRTKLFAISVARFCKSLPYDPIAKHYVAQVIRSSSSIGANYRAACRAKSMADFINKLKISEEEADETVYFLDLIDCLSEHHRPQLEVLAKEGNELLAILVSSINTARRNLKS
jgi:four helix bundle protein